MNKYSCEEHIDVIIDMFIDEEETFPVLTKMEQEIELSTGCALCGGKPIYMVANK